MKAHLYKVVESTDSQSLDQLLTIIETKPLEERFFAIGQVECRVENVEKRNDGIWYLNFAKARRSGPGRMSPNSETIGFRFNDGECFSEETAMIFSPSTHYAVIEYNHYGLKSGSIQDYLNRFPSRDRTALEFRVKLDPSVERKLQSQLIIRSLNFSIDTRHLSNDDLDAGLSLGDALRLGNEEGAEIIKVELRMSRDSSGGFANTIANKIRDLRALSSRNQDVVKHLEVTGKINEDQKQETLNLLGQKLEITTDIDVGSDLRIPINQRWNALNSAVNVWLNNSIIEQ